MADRDGYESKAQKLLPFSTNPKFSWMEWKAYLLIFVATILLLGEGGSSNKLWGAGRECCSESRKSCQVRAGKRLSGICNLPIC